MSFKIRILIIGLAVTFIPVSFAFAKGSEEFVACQQMKWKDGKKAKKNCFRDLARERERELSIIGGLLNIDQLDEMSNDPWIIIDTSKYEERIEELGRKVDVCRKGWTYCKEKAFRNME